MREGEGVRVSEEGRVEERMQGRWAGGLRGVVASLELTSLGHSFLQIPTSFFIQDSRRAALPNQNNINKDKMLEIKKKMEMLIYCQKTNN